MIDSVNELLALANPVPLQALGEIRRNSADKLLSDITTTRTRGGRSRGRRRLAIALLVGILVGVPVAFAASRSSLLDFALGDPPPVKVRNQLERMLLPDFGSKEGPPQWRSRKDIIRSSERLVAQVTTSAGVVAHMYAVNLRGGGACWVTVGKPFGGGGCGGRTFLDSRRISGSVGMLFAGMGKREAGTFGQGVTWMGRTGAPKAASIRLDFKDGAAASIPVHDGWFMYEVPVGACAVFCVSAV